VRDSSDSLEEIRQRVDIVEVISAYVALKRAGQNYKGLCPFHSEKTPSFNVLPTHGFYKCFGCDAKGDVFSFVAKIENISFVEAAEKLARRAGVEFRRRGDSPERATERQHLFDINALAERFFREELRRAPAIQQYLRERGLEPETWEEFALGYAPAGWERLLQHLKQQGVSLPDAEKAGLIIPGTRGLRDRFVDRVIFPIHDVEGRPIAFGGRALGDGQPKYLNSAETPTFIKGRTLYGLDRARKAIPAAGYVIAVEGYMDLIACHQAGLTHSVATLGTAMTPEHVQLLRRYANRLVLAYDGDSAGMTAAMRSAPMFVEAECEVRIMKLPAGTDPDSFLKERGAGAFLELVEAAAPVMEHALDHLARQYDLTDPQQRLQMVREAVEVLTQLSGSIARDHYLSRLGEITGRLTAQWYPGDVTRARSAQEAIHHEIARKLRSAPVRANVPPRTDPAAAATPAPRRPAPKANGQARAEACVLRAALTKPEWRAAVCGRVTPEQFVEPDHQRLARVVLGNNTSEDFDSRRLDADEELTRISSELLVEDGGPALTSQALEDCLRRIETYWRKRRKDELEAEIDQGSLSKSDPGYQEYLQLVRVLHGQGLKGED
jgi:DNA primase